MSDFDQMVVVVDWLDACRKRDLQAVVGLYACDASLECRCGGVRLYRGRAELEGYWRPRLDAFSSAAFELDGIHPVGDGVELHCTDAKGASLRVLFGFCPDGKIVQSLCEPLTQRSTRCAIC